MKKILLIFSLFLFNNYFSQINIEPLELTKKLLLDKDFDSKLYSIDEFTGEPNSKSLEKNLNTNFRLLEQNDSTSVVNVTIKDINGKGFDCYFHLKKDKVWKICAFRGLAMTGMLEKIRDEFEKFNDKQIEDLIKTTKDSELKEFETKDEFKNYLKNINLTLAFDDEIINHFNINKDKFESLKDKIQTEKDDYKTINEKYKSEIKELNLNSIYARYLPCEDCISFVIGGMIDNTVGYFFQSDKSKVPLMTPNRVIMIREIGNGWYIFKTT